ncbi:chorismate mutase [Sneathiella chinensis]|uniref:chorismate mutase n=1 Tax=Sneathiella chinensis TaxID=349750 RepID=A0ABQ5U2A9_9PROT|nr:chorismate mutase [Sneathiella chinensis]GLQ05305.1 chorismate mutase [Sneathiella chinensis]
MRAEIDRLDDELLGVLEKRVSIVSDIAAAKKDDGRSLAFRPGREAQVLRRILETHSSDLPGAVIARIWREMISAVCRLQKPHRVSVTAPEKSVGYWDLARSHFGSATPMSLHVSPTVVLREVSTDPATLGVLPWMNAEKDSWWVHLAQGGETVPKILAALPFSPNQGGAFEDLNALVIGQSQPEPSGNDTSLMVLVTSEEVSRARLNDIIGKADLPGHCIDSRSPEVEEGDWLHLFEMPEFVSDDDERLSRLMALAGEGAIKVVILGAYAVPLSEA